MFESREKKITIFHNRPPNSGQGCRCCGIIKEASVFVTTKISSRDFHKSREEILVVTKTLVSKMRPHILIPGRNFGDDF